MKLEPILNWGDAITDYHEETTNPFYWTVFRWNVSHVIGSSEGKDIVGKDLDEVYCTFVALLHFSMLNKRSYGLSSGAKPNNQIINQAGLKGKTKFTTHKITEKLCQLPFNRNPKTSCVLLGCDVACEHVVPCVPSPKLGPS